MTASTGTGSPLAKARAAIPGHTDLTRARDQVAARIAQVRAAQRHQPPPDHAIIDDVLATLTAGADLPTDLGARIIQARHHAAEHQAEVAALTELATRINNEITRLRATHADTALTALRAEHDELMHAAKDILEQLNGVANAHQAVQRGVGAEWGELDRLAAAHAELRAAQAVIYADSRRTPPAPHDDVTADERKVIDTFGTAQSAPRLQDIRVPIGGGLMTKPTRGRVPPWCGPDPVENLRQVIAAGSWLPSLAQLAAAQAGADTDPPQDDQSDPDAEIPGIGFVTRDGGWQPRLRRMTSPGLRSGEPLQQQQKAR